ncbi:MAG: type II toxin-antitoxin system RatA family toxin [Acidiphilium sp.]|nr:type II toxin-antitoxin system RatA family toxin [Acidiphilium sp.]MDD4935093.1 type II toxin-antitoxin system RatA family toxin [Acidiphilium sp.]
MTTHHVERVFAYPIAPLFALIADIESYPLYMPGWQAARIDQRAPQHLEVEQVVSLAGLSLQFRSVAELDPPHRLQISSSQSPFRKFRLVWQLRSLCPTSTAVRADFDLSFRTAVFERIAERIAPIMLNRTIEAFAQRAAHHLPVLPPEI